MRRKQVLALAWENLKLRRLRTTLTTLGVVIGITAVIALASLGEGFRVTVTARLEQGFELNVLTVIPGSLFAGLSPQRFTDYDVQNISRISGVQIATPVMQLGNVTLYDGDRKVQAFVATAVNFTDFINVFPDRFSYESGRAPGTRNNTMVIGYRVNHPNETEQAFAEAGDNVTMTYVAGTQLSITPPYIQYIHANYTFTVAGTLDEKGTPGLTNFDYWVFLPLDWARTIFFSSPPKPPESDLIFAKISNPNDSDNVAKEIEALFPPYRISILVPSAFIGQVDYIISLIQLFLTSIASISLLVAGVGIMNIMTVSVMERTREIGIMKAIGAKSRTILIIFLTEATLIGVLGGLLGVPTGFGLSYLLSYLISNFMGLQQQGTVLQNPDTRSLMVQPIFLWYWAVGAIVFGILVCFIFSLYPARKAAKLDPVKALRYE